MRLANVLFMAPAMFAMPASALVVDFDEFPTGSTFEDSVRFNEGETFSSAGVLFETVNTGLARQAVTYIGQAGFGENRPVPSTGNYLYPRSVRIDLGASVGTRPFVSIPFYDGGGVSSLSVNGSVAQFSRGTDPFDGTTHGGVAVTIVGDDFRNRRIELRGDIDTVEFGGQESIYDNLFIADTNLPLVEVVTLPGQGETVATDAPLEAGAPYRVEVVGAVGVSGPTGPQADAEYVGFDSPLDAIGDIDVGVLLDGAPVDWGPYTNDHVYSTDLIGTGTPLSMAFADTFAADNVGSLTVLVYRIPEPGCFALALMAAGLALPRRSV